VRAPQYRRQASNVVIRPLSVRQSDANFVQAGNNSAIWPSSQARWRFHVALLDRE
jgi:hypothetical protein